RRELLDLPLLADALDLDIQDALGRPDQRDGDQEAGQLVHRDQGPLHEALGLDAGDVLGMAENRADHLLRAAALTQDLRADYGMTLDADVGVALVVEVVQQSDQAPEVRILTEALGIGPHRRFHREHVAQQMRLCGVLGDELPGFCAIHQVSSLPPPTGMSSCRPVLYQPTESRPRLRTECDPCRAAAGGSAGQRRTPWWEGRSARHSTAPASADACIVCAMV